MADESKTGGDFSGTVVVLGSTGNIGSATVNALSSSYGGSATIKAAARNPESDKAKALAKLAGVSVVKGDMADPASVAEAVTGADVVIIVTPGAENRAQLAVNAAKAVAGAGVTNIAAVSVPFAEDSTHLFAKQFRELEAGVREAAPTAVFVKLPLFTDNLWASAQTIKTMGKFFTPCAVDKPYVTVAVADAGAVLATIAGNFAAHAGKSYVITSDRSTLAEVAAAASAAVGKEITAVEVPDEAAVKAMVGLGFPEWQARGVVELWNLIRAGDANVSEASGDLETILGRPGTTTKAWFEAVKGGFTAAE